MFLPMRCRTRTRVRRGQGTASSCRWCGVSRGSCQHDVRVLDIDRAAAGFDARFSALRRHYVYRLSTAPYGVEPQEARYVTAWPRPLDVEAMSAASRDLVGLHDFAAFCRQREGATTIRDLQRLDWSRDGDRVTAYVSADAFCWSMVRSLVGALLAVGEHRREPGWCATLLTSTQRSSDFAAAPPHGLTLVGVDYPPDDRTRGAHEGNPRSAGGRLESCQRRNRRPDWPCLPGRTRWRDAAKSYFPRCSGRLGCRSGSAP